MRKKLTAASQVSPETEVVEETEEGTPPMMRDRAIRPSELSTRELEQIVRDIQSILWIDSQDAEHCPDGIEPGQDYWNPEKPWDGEFIEMISTVLENYGLRPGTIYPVITSPERTQE